MNDADPTPSDPRNAITVILGLTALLALMLAAFAWPSSELEPRDLPIVVAGPEPQVTAVADQLREQSPGAFDITVVEDREDAVEAIEEREVYAALVTAPTSELLTAPAASPTVAQLLTQYATVSAEGGQPNVTQIVPLPKGDPRGAVFGSATLPFVLGGIATGALSALLIRRKFWRAATVTGVAVAAGFALTALMQFWLDALEGNYLLNASVVALALAATAYAVIGLHSLIGPPGIGLVALTVLLLGNPLSGIASAPELLPSGWSELGQWLPPGAAGTALRGTAFFDGAGAMAPMLILGGWVLVGALLLLVGRKRASH